MRQIQNASSTLMNNVLVCLCDWKVIQKLISVVFYVKLVFIQHRLNTEQFNTVTIILMIRKRTRPDGRHDNRLSYNCASAQHVEFREDNKNLYSFTSLKSVWPSVHHHAASRE